MTKRYTGGVVSSSLPTVNAAGASGVFLLSQQADYQSRNAWPPYKIEESLRFRSGASAYLNKTFSIAGNRKTWTWSGWVKRGSLGGDNSIFTGYGNGTQTAGIYFSNDTVTDALEVRFGPYSGSWQGFLVTTQVFRDPSAWYHIVFAADTTQATSTDRLKLYVNGVQVTAFQSSSYPSQNSDGFINQAQAHEIGRLVTNNGYLFDGYMSEINFVDGQQLTPSSFGATDKDGNWSPIAYTGTYGTNGFYVNFRDNTSATTMGYDYSGNGNNWTLNGFNVSTANTTYDIMIDVPEDQSDGTANNRGNYCTLSPLVPNGGVTISEANLKVTHPASATNCPIFGTIPMPAGSGKYYWECTILSTGSISNFNFGITIASRVKGTWTLADHVAYNPTQSVFYQYGSNGGSITSFNGTANLVVGVAVDMSAGTMAIYANNVLKGTSTAVNTALDHVPMVLTYDSDTYAANFGQRPFAYAPPSGFKALNTFNLPEPTIKQPNKYMDATIWTGDNTTPRNISNAGLFQPDFVWLKSRSNAYQHNLYDAVRGAGAAFSLSSDQSAAEGGNSNVYGFLSAFNSTGFQVTQGTAGSGGAPNGNAYGNQTSTTYVGWQWNAGGSTVTNTSGSISAQVRANPTAGFSIATYTGNGSNSTVGHGLGVAPSMVIVKNRGGSYNWLVYHKFMATSSPATWYMSLNSTSAASNGANVWIDDPTSTVFTVSGSYPEVNGSTNTYVAYCFAPIAGYSAFGSYTGNGSTLNDGPFVHTGFRPRFIMGKRADSTGGWWMFDTARSTFNLTDDYFYAQLSDAEFVDITTLNIDVLSNGFKVRSGSSPSTWINASGGTYIYMAFAEAPFKYARSR